MSELAVFACRGNCAWSASSVTTPGLAGPIPGEQLTVFRCAGCGSEWVRSELWTPVQADGTVPDAVATERARR